MIIDEQLKRELETIENEEKALLTINSLCDDRVLAKKKELENVSADEKEEIIKEIKQIEDEIATGSAPIKQKTEEKKAEAVRKSLRRKLAKVKERLDTLNQRIDENSKELLKIKNDMISSDEEKTLELIDKMKPFCNSNIRLKSTANEIEKAVLAITKSLDLKGYSELLNAYFNAEDIMFSLNMADDSIKDDVPVKKGKPVKKQEKNSEEEKIKKATELVEKLEKDLTEENLKNAKEAVALLSSGDIRNKLAERITTCEKKMEEEKLKSKEIDEIKKLLDEAEANKDLNKLSEARNRIIALPDGEEKRKLFDRANELNFVILIEECENKVYNEGEIVYDSVKELTSIYSTFNDEKKAKYDLRLNKLIAQHNVNDQWAYQDEVMSDKPEKYKFIEKFSEFLSGVVWNKIISSKFYSKFISKKLKKAEEKNNDKKIEKNKKKLSKIGIVNGCKLFMARNKIAKLKPVLFDYRKKPPVDDEEEKDYNKINKKYSKAVGTAIRKVSKKLNEYSEKEHIMQNKDAVVNMIKQYLDVLAMTSELDNSYNETTNFINNAKTNGIIDECEAAAYLFEANNIYLFRNNEVKPPYETSSKELDGIITYYDSNEPLARKVLHLTNTGSNNN